jgi:uncharacterized protein YbjT (DUF2867 family)
MGRKLLVTGATGFIGSRLARALLARGYEVRCLVRDRRTAQAQRLEEEGCEVVEGNLLRPETLKPATDGVETAYYLVHTMGRGNKGDFARLDREAAGSFAAAARGGGVARVVYLGGLGDQPRSRHLRSRHETAVVLREEGPPLTYFRAGMVVGPGSESYRTLRYLVQRLPGSKTPPNRSPSTTRSPTWSKPSRSPPRSAQRSRSEDRMCSPTARCLTGWRRSWGSDPGPGSRCR